MPANPPDNYPITGLCVVSDPNKCPPGYELLYRSHDRNEDCDLWKDSFFKSRVLRYLCITRAYPLSQGKLNNVLADIVIQNDREIPPMGFTLLEKTQDSGEKATRKKQICVRLLPRESARDAINEVIIHSQSRRPPSGYTLAGEVNDLLICFKIGTIPKDSTPSPIVQTPPVVQETPAVAEPNYPLRESYSIAYTASVLSLIHSMITVVCQEDQSRLQRTVPLIPSLGQWVAALFDVPFQLHPRYQSMRQNSQLPAPEISFRSLVDISNEFDYNFQLERQCRQRVSSLS
ncbi:hypothetical protein CAPTEDRAFT_222878 [Capitella teleta]|uniref:MABP domain-containing protein n=1 Tax=Capitella teleta TaxID=283909 RepID=R7U6C3_CAPTE|nr:hypothetical protein CAPTEDRAFT_222878 [Capitella teleta]|eukprot:ELU01524.1 hypothetical protein CAPTEDRAFT_222878 [Capitella teleta]